jgi:hypothetical protein
MAFGRASPLPEGQKLGRKLFASVVFLSEDKQEAVHDTAYQNSPTANSPYTFFEKIVLTLFFLFSGYFFLF